MSKINRWLSVVLVAVVTLLSACSSTQPLIRAGDSNTAVTATSGVLSTIPQQPAFVEPSNLQSVVSVQQPSENDVTSDDILAIALASKFNKPVAVIKDIIVLATTYAYSDFPKREDILAIIAVESGFNAKAYYKGSYGLMQLEYSSHRKDFKGTSVYNIERNIAAGAGVLHQYYSLLNNNSRSSVLAYNAGIGRFKHGKYKATYYHKYDDQKTYITSVEGMLA